MLLLLICILCNVVLAVIFKYFDHYKVDNLNAIIFNYVVCVLFASVVLQKCAVPQDLFDRPWWPFSLALALLFIVGFNVMALSFQKSGVALTVIIQKMSLIVPAAVAIAIYNEPLGILKAGGICLALVAVVLVNIPPKESNTRFSIFDTIILLPLITFALSGIIEVILFYVEVEKIVGDDGLQFTASAFGQAAVLGVIFSSVRMLRGGLKPGSKEVIGGIVLGLPNFLSIYLLVVLLSQGWQGSILFPTNSIGILILTALVGFIFYRERPDINKVIGIGLGIAAIILLSLS